MRTKIASAVRLGLRSPRAKVAHQPEMGPTAGKRKITRVAPPDDEVKGHEEKTANQLNEELWTEIEGKGAAPCRLLDVAPVLDDGVAKTAAPKAPHVPTPPGGFRDILPSLGDSLRTIVTGKGELSNAQRMQLGLVGALGGVALGTAYYNARQKAKKRQYDTVLAHVLKAPDMQDSASWQSVVPEAYAFMQRYAPSLAQDPSLARAFARTVHAGDMNDFLNFRVAKELADAEKAYNESGSTQGALRDIESLMRHPVSKAVQMGGGGGGKK